MEDKIQLNLIKGGFVLVDYTEHLEKVVVEQMRRKPNKRLYTCGIEFKDIDSIVVIKGY